jgi:2-methylcitrate dehydratase PrpD
MDQTADKISEYAASLTTSDLTPEALHAVGRSLIDSFGCALGALDSEPVKIGQRLAARGHRDAPSSLLGTSYKDYCRDRGLRQRHYDSLSGLQ